MSQIATILTNGRYHVTTESRLIPEIEIILVVSEKEYRPGPDGKVERETVFRELRFSMSAKSLSDFIGKLQATQIQLAGLSNNAAAINELIDSVKGRQGEREELGL